MRTAVFFTDLDGSLLDAATYSYHEALSALNVLRNKNIPLVISSSKTRAEIELYRANLENRHPFISENGGGIFIPSGYFGPATGASLEAETRKEKDYLVIILGAEYGRLRKTLKEVRSGGFDVRGFGDMDAGEIAASTGLGNVEAALAKQREFDEPFFFEGSKKERAALIAAIEARGFRYTQGALSHIKGESDKGTGVEMLTGFYRLKHPDLITVAIGDSLNDLPMLEKVDYPVVVQKPGGEYDPRIDVPGLIRATGVGPQGWNRAVLELVETLRL